MNLEDLFVSYRQVEPISFNPINPVFSNELYGNLERVKKFTQNFEDSEVSNQLGDNNQEQNNYYDWKVNVKYSPKPTTKPPQPNNVSKQQQATNTSKEVINKPINTDMLDMKQESSLLKKYRSSPNYSEFRKELDKFITNNPQYRNIKNNLDYLAALESNYVKNVDNYAGSKALGWFQFLDNTRSTYNQQSREEFANDSQAQLKAAAQYYSDLQKQVQNWGGDPDDFVTMYSAWWRPESTRKYIEDNNYDYHTQYNESLSKIRKRAQDLFINGKN